MKYYGRVGAPVAPEYLLALRPDELQTVCDALTMVRDGRILLSKWQKQVRLSEVDRAYDLMLASRPAQQVPVA